MNLYGLLSQSAARMPSQGAVFQGRGLFATYAELNKRVLSLAGRLSERADIGDRALIVSSNCPEYVELLFACWAVGLVAVPVNAKLHPTEVQQIIEDAQPKVIFSSRRIAPQLGSPSIVIDSPEYNSLLTGAPIDPVDVQSDDVAWLFYTSGTTGRSKGAMLTHHNLHALVVSYLADFDSVESDHSLIHAAPMSHGSGLYIPVYVARGARHVIPESTGFTPAEFIDLCNDHPKCGAFMAPTMVSRLVREIEAGEAAPGNLRTIAYGGGPMYIAELVRAKAALGSVLIQLYGQGEAPMTITGLRRKDHLTEDPDILGSVGWPRSGVEVAILDEKGNVASANTVGEIVCRGDIVMAGYWNNPEATAEAVVNGWLHTGDMGEISDTGRLTLRDRSKDVIISGGSNIYPREVEEVLLTHKDVAEVSVVGDRNSEWGEIVVAYVVPENGRSLDTDKLDAHCLKSLARFKRPKRYIAVNELPKNSYGKVLKRTLIQQLNTPADS